jgi:hypothetical protein
LLIGWPEGSFSLLLYRHPRSWCLVAGLRLPSLGSYHVPLRGFCTCDVRKGIDRMGWLLLCRSVLDQLVANCP